MSNIDFVKMVATGNDFVVVDSRYSLLATRYSLLKLARLVCDRKTGVGADGILVLGRSKKADFSLRIFNPDGSEPEMCGNGLRCAVLYAKVHKKKISVETKAGIYEAEVIAKDRVKIKMVDPKDLRLDFPIQLNNREIKVNFINTGVPHTVIFVQGIDEIDVPNIGRNIRYHKEFSPAGTNADFVEELDDKNIKMRTYERGVEGETFACGTGAVASAIVSNCESKARNHEINVHTKGGILKVYFKKIGNEIKDVYLEGEARQVFTGRLSL